MADFPTNPQNLSYVFTCFQHSEELVLPSKTIPNLKTALRQYILPHLPFYSFTKTELKGKNFLNCLEEISIDDFLASNPMTILKTKCAEAVTNGTIGKDVCRTTYVPPLNHFLRFLEEEKWNKEEETTAFEGKYAPKREYNKDSLHHANRGRRVYHDKKYALNQKDLPNKIKTQIQDLKTFCTGQYVPHRQDKKMRQVTFKNHVWHIQSYLGWLVKYRDYSPEELDINLFLDLNLLNEFIGWGINDKGNTSAWANGFCECALNIAKWKYAPDSKQPMYRDIPIIGELRMINNTLRHQYEEEKKANLKQKKEEKEMTFEQCQALVKYLRQCCAERNSYGSKRTDITIVRSYLRYLLVAIFTYCPIRQREVRELELGRTIYRMEQGYRIILEPDDNKTKDKRDFMLSKILPPYVLADLTNWLDVWHPKIVEATESLDNWLAFIGRRDYTTEVDLKEYLAQLQENKSVMEGVLAKVSSQTQSVLNVEQIASEIVDYISLKNKSKTKRPRKAITVEKVTSEILAYTAKGNKSIVDYLGKKINEIDNTINSVTLNLTTYKKAHEQLQSNSKLVFISFGNNTYNTFGCQLEAEDVFSIVSRAVYTASVALIETNHPLFKGTDPRRTNPHFFRNIGITHERRHGDPAKRKAFHKVIGNSEEVGDKVYNIMEPGEKTVDAKYWWKTDNSMGKQRAFIKIKTLLPKLSHDEILQLKRIIEEKFSL
ncbi:hypothetical protein [Cyanobacterium aponinum]|uniref:Uncharacterized protein n=1 Tax=Cyanobacterium aponinum 0216 TaxID=2676140 RepID=A0A844GVZ5_9CHRO|nr:hypothetical protein [Cyanobacterium aponinum]MTF40320.1 hypothetical protein [Cyanobacterium aponinum 0216]